MCVCARALFLARSLALSHCCCVQASPWGLSSASLRGLKQISPASARSRPHVLLQDLRALAKRVAERSMKGHGSDGVDVADGGAIGVGDAGTAPGDRR